MNKNGFRILKLSIEEAREYYYGDNDAKKEIALMLFNEDELTNLDINDIFYKIDYSERLECDKYRLSLRDIYIVAKYFNKGWEKTYNNDGYFWDYHPDYGWKLKKHTSVKYPGIVYYKNEYFAKMVFDICKNEYNNIK